MTKTRKVLALLSVAFVIPLTALRRQQPELEVFGFIRPDGVVLPQLALGPEGWYYIGPTPAYPEPEPIVWPQMTEYHAREWNGAASTVQAVGMVRVCCDVLGNPHWAHGTSVSGTEVEEYGGVAGYVVTNPIADAPFVPASPALPVGVEHLLDSLSTLSDTFATKTSAAVWRAELDEEAHTFFQVEQSGLDRYIGCFVMTGWLSEGDPQGFEIASQGWDDCEGKGHGHRRPWALLKRDGELLMAINLWLWEDQRLELWRHRGGQDWEVFYPKQ